MKTLAFLGFTSIPENRFWFITENNGQKEGFTCNGLGIQLSIENDNSEYREIGLDDLKDFPEVQQFIRSKLN